MAETVAQYTARIQSYIEGKEPLAVQRETYGKLANVVRGASVEKMRRRPDVGAWSAGEVLAHLADVETAHSWRYRQILESSGVALNSFNQDDWARLGNYGAADPGESLELFRLLRQKNLSMFDRLSPEDWERFGMHAERGKLRLSDLVAQIAGHDLNHIRQIEQLLK